MVIVEQSGFTHWCGLARRAVFEVGGRIGVPMKLLRTLERTAKTSEEVGAAKE
jgi:hypothetical protein